MSSCARYVSRTCDVINDITRSQSRSNLEIHISPSIFPLQRRSKSQMQKCSWLSCWHIQLLVSLLVKKSLLGPQKISNIKHSFNLIWDMKRSSQIMLEKVFFTVMTPSLTSHGGLKIGSLHSFVNEERKAFNIIKNRQWYSNSTWCIYVLWNRDYTDINSCI